MENGGRIFQKSIIDVICGIWKNSKITDVNSIFKDLVKNNATNIDIHSIEKEVNNMAKNRLLENRKTWQGLHPFLY